LSSFASLPLLPSLLKSLAEQQLTTLTDVQAQALPVLLSGRSLVGVSETGSGKTLAFVLPLLHQLKSLEIEGSSVEQSGRPRGLVLVPSRELGEQVSKVFKSFTHDTRLRVRTALGGTKKQIARQNVAGSFEVLVATPGRLSQLMDEGDLRLTDVRTVVFDEADQMLDPGFLPIALALVGACPKEAQLVLFSATFPVALEQAVNSLFPTPPARVRTQGSQRLVPTLTTSNRKVLNGDRFSPLQTALSEAPKASTILFVNTLEQCDKVAAWLEAADIAHVVYRGQMERSVRRDNLQRFRGGEVPLLLTTDLGGRGLDIELVERVINVNLPNDIDNYLHRVGRTARAGRPGLVINLVTERDQTLLAKLKKRESAR